MILDKKEIDGNPRLSGENLEIEIFFELISVAIFNHKKSMKTWVCTRQKGIF